MSNMLFLYVYIIHHAYMYSSLYTCNCTVLFLASCQKINVNVNVKDMIYFMEGRKSLDAYVFNGRQKIAKAIITKIGVP